MSAAARHCRRTCQVESELGRGKIGPIQRIQTPKRKKSHPQRTNSNSRTSQRAELRTMSAFDNELLCACMHALRAAAALNMLCLVDSIELGTSDESL